MNFLYNFPKQAAFGRALPKNKIYEHAAPGSKVKDLFVQEVEKIIWSYKLSPETINLPAQNGVQEIQILTITLKTQTLKYEILQAIDKAIPSPIIFILTFSGKIRYVAAYKRASEADKSKWVISSYFETDWIEDLTTKDTKRELPVVLNMGAMYEALLKDLIPLPFRQGETLDELVLRVDQLRIKKREAVTLTSRIKKEKQFNRRVELNRSLNELKMEIGSLENG